MWNKLINADVDAHRDRLSMVPSSPWYHLHRYWLKKTTTISSAGHSKSQPVPHWRDYHLANLTAWSQYADLSWHFYNDNCNHFFSLAMVRTLLHCNTDQKHILHGYRQVWQVDVNKSVNTANKTDADNNLHISNTALSIWHCYKNRIRRICYCI